MNTVSVLHPAQKILTAIAVAVVAATCLVSAGTTASASSHHQQTHVVQAGGAKAQPGKTKEW
jgi:hypothetical protein